MQAHAQDFLAYAYLQTGQDALAEKVRDEVSGYRDRFGRKPHGVVLGALGDSCLVMHLAASVVRSSVSPHSKSPNALFEAKPTFAKGRSVGARTGDLVGAKSNAGQACGASGSIAARNQGLWQRRIWVE